MKCPDTHYMVRHQLRHAMTMPKAAFMWVMMICARMMACKAQEHVIPPIMIRIVIQL